MNNVFHQPKRKTIVASSLYSPYPAVKVLSLFGLPHTSDVGREDGYQCRENGFGLGPAGVLGKQAVHYGGALHYQTCHILRDMQREEMPARTEETGSETRSRFIERSVERYMRE